MALYRLKYGIRHYPLVQKGHHQTSTLPDTTIRRIRWTRRKCCARYKCTHGDTPETTSLLGRQFSEHRRFTVNDFI